MVPIQVSAGPQLRQFRQPPPTVNNNNNAVKSEGPPVTVFVGKYKKLRFKEFIDLIHLYLFRGNRFLLDVKFLINLSFNCF